MTRVGALALLLFVIGFLPIAWPMPPLLAAILTAPSLLLIPTGLGLVATFGCFGKMSPNGSSLQGVLLAYFLGIFLLILLFVVVERFSVSPAEPAVLTGGACILALLGLLLAQLQFAVPQRLRWILLSVTVSSLLLICIHYYFSTTIYSKFPVTDLFQRIQFHGGAWQFSKTSILNPFVAGSYIPFQQLQLGLLMHFTGADPLIAEWVWPVAFAPLQAAVLYAFLSRLVPTPRGGVLAFALAFAQFDLSNPTNGSIAELATITVMSLLIIEGHDGLNRCKQMPHRLLALVTGILIGLALAKMPLHISAFAALAIILVGSLLALDRRLTNLIAVVILAAITLLFHRGALLYLVLGGAGIACYHTLLVLQLSERRSAHKFSRYLLVALVLAAAAMTVRILSLRQDGADAFGLWEIFDLVLKPLIGKSMAAIDVDRDLAPGAGARVALFELARSVSPFAYAFAIGAMIVLLSPPLRRRWTILDSIAGKKAMAQTMVFLCLTIIILTGFPFIHRAAFLIVLFSSAAAINILLGIPASTQSQRAFAFASTAYVIAIVGTVFVAAPTGVQPYIHRASPAFMALGASLVSLQLLCNVFPKARRWGAGIIFIAAVATEVVLSKTYFKPYAFNNQAPPQSGAFASFDQEDLQFATDLSSRMSGSQIIVSDPKTMTFLQGRTGLAPLASTSNLDTISPPTRTDLTSALNPLISKETSFDVCAKLNSILDRRASGIFNYSNLRSGVTPLRGADALGRLGYDNRLVPSYNSSSAELARDLGDIDDYNTRDFVIIFNATTLKWLSDPDRLSYFPVRAPLSAGIIANLDKYFDSHYLYHDNYVATIKCNRTKN